MRACSPLCRAALLCLLLALALVARGRAQLFPQPTVIPTGNWPAAIYTADVNGDGFPDLIYIDHGAVPGGASTTHVLVNDGKGHFTQTATLATVGNSLAIGNLTNQGRVDIAWITQACFPGSTTLSVATVHVALGSSSATYASMYSLSGMAGSPLPLPVYGYLSTYQLTGSNAFAIAAQDVTNNVLQNFEIGFVNGSPAGYATTFNASIPDGVGPAAALPVENVTGLVEIVVSSQLGQAADVFQVPHGFGIPQVVRFQGASGVRSLLLKDVTGDGLPDLVVEGAAGHIDVFPNVGSGVFSTQSIGGTGTLDGTTGNGGHLIALADLNHDGLPDALTSTPAGVSTLLGNGTAYLGLKGIYNAGPGMHTFATADFNGDGNLDLATDSPEGIAILYGNADGSFQTGQAFAAGQPVLSGVLGQFTASGNLDALVSTGATQSQLLLGKGDGTFTPVGGAASPAPTTSSPGAAGLWSGLIAEDLNGDGKLDLLTTADGCSNQANGCSAIAGPGVAITYQLGNGDGTFQPLATFGGAAPAGSGTYFYGVSTPYSVSGVGPAFANESNFGAYAILGSDLSTGTAAFIHSESDAHAHNLVIAGRLRPATASDDLIVEDEGSLFVLLTRSGATSQTLGDLHQDGSLTTPGQMVAPDISGTFPGPSKALGLNAFPGSGTIADLDGDGNGDLLITYADLAADPTAPVATAPNYLYIWFGSGGGKFLTSTAHPVNPVRVQLSRNYYQEAVADLNGDGKPDLILSDGYLIDVQYGNGDGTFGAEQHYLAGRGINTISVADLRHRGVLDLVVADGGTVFSNVVINKEVLTPNPDVSTGGVTVLLSGGSPKATTGAAIGTLAAQPEPSPFESVFALNATLTPPSAGVEPTGTVAFTLDGIAAGTGTVSAAGIASVTVPATGLGAPLTPILPGAHTLAASYSGDSTYAALTLSGSHTVSLGTTTVTLTPTTPLTTQYGGPADGTFAVQVQDATYPATGTYTLLDNGTAIAICTNLPLAVNGVPVSCPYGNPVLLNAGTHAFQVRYNGDAVNGPAISAAVVYTILPDPSTLTLTSSLNPANVGQAVTFTATLTGTLAAPAGSIQFLDGSTVLGVVALTGGPVSFTTSTLTVGIHTITAVYAGTPDFYPAVSTPLTETIQNAITPLASITTLISSLNPAPHGLPVTLTANVQAPGVFAQIPTGAVTFLDGTVALGVATLDANGNASFTISTLTVGSHRLTASYAGDTQHGLSGVGPRVPGSSLGTLPSVSAVLTQIITTPLGITPAGFTLTVSPNPVTIGVGRTAVLLVTVQELGNLNQPVALTCTGDNMTESACTFILQTIPSPGGATTMNLSTAAPHDCGDPSQPYFLGRNGGSPLLPMGGALAALAGCGLLARRRRSWRLLLRLATVLTLGGLATLSGCGHCTDLGTRPGSSSVIVTATASGGTVQSVKVPVTVTIP